MIKIYGYPNTRSDRVNWVLEELEQEYEYHLVDLTKGDSRSPEYHAINPAGKIPAMLDDDLILTESAAIISYLADKFPEAGLIPAVGSKARGLYNQWSYFALCELEQPLWTISKHKFAIPAEHRVTGVINTAVWEFQRALELLSKGLADRDYILDDGFSGADILLGHTLIWGIAFKQEISQDNLKAYVERLQQRPARARARHRSSLEQ
ncbi:MAG: glutathione S-transferase family protein [Pseudomonadales bacterium]